MTVLRGLDARLRLARLGLLTAARPESGDLAELLAAAFAGGVDLVQLRGPGLTREAVEVARRAAARTQGLVGVRGAVPLAGEVQADLLHLGQSDATPADARRHLHPYALLGRSTHDRDQLEAALADDDLDYLSVGPVRLNSADPAHPPAGVDLVRAAAEAAPVFAISAKPWFAVGGVTTDTLPEVLSAGARRVLVSTAVTRAPDPETAARALASALGEAWRADPASERYTVAAAASPGRRR